MKHLLFLLLLTFNLFANIPQQVITESRANSTEIYYTYGNDQLISKGSVTYTYDANGNLISDGTRTYSYDEQNRLIKVETPDKTIEYSYDAEGNRIAKMVNGETTTYLVDTNTPFAQVITESKSNGTEIHYTYGNDLLSDGVHNFLTDALGSTRGLVDSSETLTDSYAYTPYGELIHHEGTSENSFLFTGEQRDAETGDYYLRARYYSPALTRFLSRDTYSGTLTDPLSQNRYLYVGGNPIRYTDPSGHFFGGIAAAGFSMSTLATSGILSIGITSGILFQLRANKQYYINVRYGKGHGYVHASSIHGDTGYQYDFVYRMDNALIAELGAPVLGYIRKTSTHNFFNSSFVRLSGLQFKAWELAIFKIFPKAPYNGRYSQRHMIYWKPVFNCYGYAYYAYLQGIVAMLTVPSL